MGTRKSRQEKNNTNKSTSANHELANPPEQGHPNNPSGQPGLPIPNPSRQENQPVPNPSRQENLSVPNPSRQASNPAPRHSRQENHSTPNGNKQGRQSRNNQRNDAANLQGRRSKNTHRSDDLETIFQDRSLPSIPERSRSKRISQPQRSRYRRLNSNSESDEESDVQRQHSLLLPRLDESEEQFLQFVTDDDLEATKTHVENHSHLNINCINFQGLSALHLAITNRSEAMVEYLLTLPNIDIADTVLHAIRDNQMKIMKMLLEAQSGISPGLEFAGCLHSTDFPEYVTPLMLAAQCGHYESVTLLIERGHRLEKPHPPNCTCTACKTSFARDDPLQVSSARLALYRAICSPAYIVHTAVDPVVVAFRLSAELELNASWNRQLAAAYLQLREDVSTFTVDIIGCCRSSDETELLMRQTLGTRGRKHFIFPRLLMAMDYRQKEFVAHPNTQQVLESYWMGDWYGWRSSSTLMKAVIVATRIPITPLIFLMCLVLPRNKLTKHWQIPLNKLITHATGYFVFLLLVFIISNRDKTDQKRGPPKTGAEGPLILFVCGYTWSAARMCVMQGPRRFLTELWNWGEIVMLSLFGLTFLLWTMAAVDVAVNDKEDLERKFWNQYDPTLLAEGSFCVATIIAYFRLMFLCQLNYHLGPLQVSLGKMTVDIYKYLLVFVIIISAFAVGLARFYQYYDGMIYTDESGMKTVQVSSFTSLTDTLNTFFWALFCMAPIESADVVLENIKDNNSTDVDNRHAFTEKVGYLCFACFEVISVIVVLNMLIATMSNTFQRVTDNVAIEWTFGRTEVYVDYISQTALPSPYNLIPTATGVGNMLEYIRARTFKTQKERDMEEARQKDFPVLMSQLVQRYFRDKESSFQAGTGLEGEIEGLRREIQALKTVITDSK